MSYCRPSLKRLSGPDFFLLLFFTFPLVVCRTYSRLFSPCLTSFFLLVSVPSLPGEPCRSKASLSITVLGSTLLFLLKSYFSKFLSDEPSLLFDRTEPRFPSSFYRISTRRLTFVGPSLFVALFPNVCGQEGVYLCSRMKGK